MTHLTRYASIGLLLMIGLLMGSLTPYVSAHPQQAQQTRKIKITITGYYNGNLLNSVGGKQIVCKSAEITVKETGVTIKATKLKLLKDANGDRRRCQATFEDVVVLSDAASSVSGYVSIKPNNDAPESPLITGRFNSTIPKLSPVTWWHDLGRFEIR